jgi:predicted dehydrogenase
MENAEYTFHMKRRTFLMTTAASHLRILGANDRIRAGVIGAGARGQFLVEQFKEAGADVGGVCDVYEPNLRAGLKKASSGAVPFRDYRKILEDKSIGAMIIATPEHWHARMMIDAVEAGKDVYVEKPLAHKIEEGFRMVDAVARTRRIVQVGMQRRSGELFLEARKIMESGRTGEMRLVTAIWYQRGSANNRPLAGDLDWKQWLGSAPDRPVDPFRFFNWYWYTDYSGGYLISQAAHIIDCMQWFLNSAPPVAVTCAGNRPELPGTDVPQTGSISVEYPGNYLVVFTLGWQAMRYTWANDHLMQFHGNKARLDLGRERYALYQESSAPETAPDVEKKSPGSFNFATLSHVRNFLECVASRKQPNAPVEAGQATNVVLCMAMESYRTGRRLRWNAQTRRAEG